MSAPTRALSQGEFIALMAMTAATVAFSIDSMLPAIPDIGAELSPTDLNKAQLILTSFVLGMGLGTFFTGPLSDAYGRRPVLFGGVCIYIIGSLIAWQAATLEVMLAARGQYLDAGRAHQSDVQARGDCKVGCGAEGGHDPVPQR